MSFAPKTLYATNSYPITLILSLGNAQEERFLRVITKSFGKRYVSNEEIAPPHYRALTLLPGGALEARR